MSNYACFLIQLWYILIVDPIIAWYLSTKGVKYNSVLFSHGHNKAFLVPDSCRATVRNGSSISVCPFQTIWQLFGTLKHCRISTIFVHC